MNEAITKKDTLKIENLIHGFLFHCRYEKNLNQKTLKAYNTDLEQFSQFMKSISDAMEVENIKKDILKAYLREISRFKPKTIKRKIASLKAMLNYLEYEDDNYINPFRKVKVRFKEPYTLPVVMTIEEVKKIFQLIYKEREKNKLTGKYAYKAQTRDIAILELLFATGVRVSELCGLKPVDVDIRNGIIKVFGKGSKERIIQVCQSETLSILRLYKNLYKEQIDNGLTFFVNRIGRPLSTQSVRLMVKHYIKRAGITKKVTPHTFRHTFATLLLEEDVDIKYIQNLLGHSSISTTQIYTHVNTVKQRKILATKHPRRRLTFSGSLSE